MPQLFYQLRKKLDDIRGELPRDLIGPNVNDEYGDVDSVLYMLTGDGADYAQLKKVAEGLRQRLLKVPGRHQGQPLRRAGREASSSSSATPSWRPSAFRRRPCSTRCRSRTRWSPPAPSRPAPQRIPLRVTGALDGAKAVADTPVEAGGRVFRLGDIATVTRGFEDPSDYLVRQRGKPALGIGVVMAKGANILAFGRSRRMRRPDAFMAAVPQGIDIEQVADQPKVVEHAIVEFEHSFLEALAIVLLVSASCRSAGAPASWSRSRCRSCLPSRLP